MTFKELENSNWIRKNYYNVEEQLKHYIYNRSEIEFAKGDANRNSIHDIGSFETYRTNMRERFIDSIGGFPSDNGSLTWGAAIGLFMIILVERKGLGFMKRQMLCYLLSFVLVLCILGGGNPISYAADAADSPIPADRSIDWSQSGIPGGIPERTQIYTTISAADYGYGSVDATAAI